MNAVRLFGKSYIFEINLV